MAMAISKLRSVLILAGVLTATAVATIAITPTATAAPTRSIYRYYYAGPAMQKVIGQGWVLKCSGGQAMSGSTSNYYRDIYADCPGGSPLPTYEECVVDGFVGPCP
jgi:hypothetical protein